MNTVQEEEEIKYIPEGAKMQVARRTLKIA